MACYLAWTPRGLSPYHATRSHTSYKVRARGRLRCPVSYCSVRHIGILWQNRHDPVMKYKLPRFSDTSPARTPGLVSAGLVLAVVVAAANPIGISAQPPTKRSGYGASRVAARPENKESATPNSRAGEG